MWILDFIQFQTNEIIKKKKKASDFPPVEYKRVHRSDKSTATVVTSSNLENYSRKSVSVITSTFD